MFEYDRDIERYIERHSSPESGLLRALDRATHLKAAQPQMSSGQMQGALLTFITRLLQPRYVLEIGTYTGYATMCFAEGLGEGAVIDTIEVHDELQSISAPFFAQHDGRIKQHIGPALEVVPAIGHVYDLVFIDGSKREYPDYYMMLMGDGGASENHRPLVRPGGYIIADNILWYGKVADTQVNQDAQTLAIDRFNKMVMEDTRVDNFILPVRDGLNIIHVL